ncbi:MAG: hypothetical protein IK118_03835 [Clostridia bacterium]|nr:hypothetical protein [Clostridia bacterium]
MKNGENTRALLRHIMKMKQRQRAQAAVLGAARGKISALPERSAADENVRMTETRIYIGLNDAQTREQIYETQQYLDILKDVCRGCRVPFSVDIEEGGYYHEDGEYTEETSFILVLIDVSPAVVRKIAKELCARFHQESVLVTQDRIDGYFINEDAEN